MPKFDRFWFAARGALHYTGYAIHRLREMGVAASIVKGQHRNVHFSTS
jgi:hypothetical protein